jgi:hypothetical protein
LLIQAAANRGFDDILSGRKYVASDAEPNGDVRLALPPSDWGVYVLIPGE